MFVPQVVVGTVIGPYDASHLCGVSFAFVVRVLKRDEGDLTNALTCRPKNAPVRIRHWRHGQLHLLVRVSALAKRRGNPWQSKQRETHDRRSGATRKPRPKLHGVVPS